TYIPTDSYQNAIEHAIAREAIRMSKKQHMEMNFNIKQIGFLDKLRQTNRDLDKITEAFYFEKALESRRFHMYDINILIGSGGILAHTENNRQTLVIISDSFKPEGITEIWKDKHFISPHMGKLSAVDEKLASKLLTEECFEKIGLVIRPMSKKWKENETIMNLRIAGKPIEIKVGEVKYFPNKTGKNRRINIYLEKGFYLNAENRDFSFESDLPIYIDASIDSNFKAKNEALNLYKFKKDPKPIEPSFQSFIQKKPIEKGKQTHKVELPYKGSILVKEGELVTPDTVIGENLYDPPRVYVISLFDKTYLHLNPENIEKSLRIKEGQGVKYGQRIAEIGSRRFIDEIQFQHYYFDSPVRGRVEKINYDSGTIIMREIQDYSAKPKTINVAKKLNIKPKLIPRYMKKNLGDFVYAGDLLAVRMIDLPDGSHPMLVSVPTTGTIKEINTETGTVTIQYDKDPYHCYAGIKGKITEIELGYSATISYEGSTLMGIIGFGNEAWGKLKYLEDVKNIGNCDKNDIVVYPSKIDIEFLKKAEKQNIKGVVAASMDNSDLIQFTGEEIGVALTGNENIPFSLIITEGFGNFKMDKDYEKFFKEHNGNLIYINGHTQIRAGVTRPKMIVMEK
ncbi:MAG: glutamate mutase L, partial [Candidatus Cloacimonetes bacterium]|nr:glutamate mutase L [Candidatus Cloacimonadota bacterium]